MTRRHVENVVVEATTVVGGAAGTPREGKTY